MKWSSTSGMGISRPVSFLRDVTPRSEMPQGTISRKKSRSVDHVEREPVARDPALDPDADGADLLRADPGPGQPRDPAGLEAVLAGHPDHHLFEIAHVLVHVAAVRLQADDRVADDLARAVVGHIAAAAGLVNLDAQFGQPLRRGQHVRAGSRPPSRRASARAGAGAAAGCRRSRPPPAGPPGSSGARGPRHSRRSRGGGRRAWQRVAASRRASGSKFSMVFFRCDMNWSATAPSISRWS